MGLAKHYDDSEVIRMSEKRMGKRVNISSIAGVSGSGGPPILWDCKVLEQYLKYKIIVGVTVVGREKEPCSHGQPPTGNSIAEKCARDK